MWQIVIWINLLSVLGCINPAQAVTATLSTGTTGPGGVATQGRYTSERGAITVDFNSSTTAPNNGFASYTGITGVSSIGKDASAPTGPSNQANDSNYLRISSGNAVTITFTSFVNYFGIALGSANSGNQVQFFRDSTALGTAFNASTIVGQTTYVDFKSTNNTTDTFNRVVLTQTTTGVFRTDNHSYRAVPFKLSPGLGILLLGALGATAHLKSKIKVDTLIKEWCRKKYLK